MISLILVVVAAAIGGMICFYQPFIVVQFLQKHFTNVIFYVSTQENVFALTFDDGPNPPYTDQILEILRQYDCRATFFLIGKQIEKHPGYIQKIQNEGHQIANHFYTDEATIFLSKEKMISSLEKTETLINQRTDVKYYRPASGWITPTMLQHAKENNFQAVLGSAYVTDPIQPPHWYMLGALKSMLRRGIIITLHDGGGDRSKTVGILAPLLENAKKKKLKSVTLEELIHASNR